MNHTQSSGKTYWKTLEELAAKPEVLEELKKEFPDDIDVPTGKPSGINRRRFMGLLAASTALAAAGCRRPEQKIVPYVNKPEYLVPGISNFYATSFTVGNFASGLLVRSREGRPVKIEGNDLDPVSGGAASVLAQASLLSLYDPDRQLRPTVNNSDSTPQNAIQRMADAIREVASNGKSVRILVDEHASPSLESLYRLLENTIPDCKVVQWPAILADGASHANRELLGVDAVLVPDLSRADVILGIDSDFLGADPEALYHIRRFASKRKPSAENPSMNRFYAVEANMSATGANADYRIRIKPTEIDEFLLALLHELVVKRGRGSLPGEIVSKLAGHANPDFDMLPRIAADLLSKKSVVLAGRHLPAETQTLVILLNSVIGAYEAEGVYGEFQTLPYSGSKGESIDELKKELLDGKVGVLLFGDVNPAYSIGAGAFRKLTSKVLYKFGLSLYADETSKFCRIFVPVNHYLESWGDARMLDGSLSVVQPLIAPLNDGQLSLGDVFVRLCREMDPASLGEIENFYGFVRTRWQKEVIPATAVGSFENFWEESLRKGLLAGTGKIVTPAFDASAASAFIRAAVKDTVTEGTRLGVLPDHNLYDGRYANLGWLQELPDPVTSATWDNLAIMSKATAEKHAVQNEDVVRLSSSRTSVELPVFIQPGVADDVVFTNTGYGRTEGGRVLPGIGQNVFLLMSGEAGSVGYVPVSIEKTGRTLRIATTQQHHSLSGPDHYGIDRSGIVKEADLEEFARNPKVLFEGELPIHGAEEPYAPAEGLEEPASLVPGFDYSRGHRWGMTIDASACVGCNACVTACVSENNIPVVGKEQVLKGREMHWIRIDRYYSGDEENPDTLLQPMLCQHCENAPCENVCPVAATTHSPEGLNEMTYNRCVGTRYCSNNCPYKVRRFNYLNYHEDERDPFTMVYNPDVTVRMRGVIEKCTFCVQRINEAKYSAKNNGNELVEDGDIVTACEQACPAEAIAFGNMNDPESRVAKLRSSERGYHVLKELNVRPSVTYLAKIRNRSGEGT